MALWLVGGKLVQGQTGAPFTHCAAIFWEHTMLVDTYSPEGVCRLSHGAQGMLAVRQVTLGPGQADPGDKTQFMVALRDSVSHTLWMLTDKPVQEISVATLLAASKPGDRLLILTLDNQWALPHAEILVQ